MLHGKLAFMEMKNNIKRLNSDMISSLHPRICPSPNAQNDSVLPELRGKVS